MVRKRKGAGYARLPKTLFKAMSAFTKSKYSMSLQNDSDKKRYEEKLDLLGCCEDPYLLLDQKSRVRSTECVEWIHWPNVSYADIYNYLINTPHEMLKAYKSMDGCNFFVNGWVSNIVVTQIEGRQHYLYADTVKHSQTLSAIPLKVWVGYKSNGEVVAAHCTCWQELEKPALTLLLYCLLQKPTPK